MILGDTDGEEHASRGPSLTLDDLFQGHAQRRPDAVALIDPLNRASFTGSSPLRLSYGKADRIVSAIAARLRDMALPTDTVVGIQLPNTVDNFLAMLGVLRAGMTVAALPLLFRRSDAAAALARVGAKAIISCDRVGSFAQADCTMSVAADVFSIRYVCGFGDNLPDGVVSFGDLVAAESPDPAPPEPHRKRGNAAAHVAVITFELGEGGVVPVARSHAELLAGGLAVLLESSIGQHAVIQSTLAPSSFAGLCLALVPWLLCGGTLVLHHPFDAATLVRQVHDERTAALILPDAVAFRLAAAGLLAETRPGSIIAAWRAPERLATSPPWQAPGVALIDVALFGEAALVPARRGDAGAACPIPLGPLFAPRHAADGIAVAEISRTEAGTIGVRGAMVPRHAFPPGIENSGLPHLMIGAGGFIDTGYACRFDADKKTLVVTGPPSGTVRVGGYRFVLEDIRASVGGIDAAAKVGALADPVVGQRLFGTAANPRATQAALRAAGLNPLIVAAFDTLAA
jgi:acyl-CoA synthetase (AMP-forming)/AMP-acid ligase II